MDKICKEKCKRTISFLSYVVAESCQMCPVLDNAKFSSDFKDKKLRNYFTQKQMPKCTCSRTCSPLPLKPAALGLVFTSWFYSCSGKTGGVPFRHPFRNNQMTIGNNPHKIAWGKVSAFVSLSVPNREMAWFEKQTKQTRPLPGTEILCMCCYLQCMPRHSWAPEPSWQAN